MNYQEQYQSWLTHLDNDSPLKQELLSIQGQEEEIEDRFYQELSFGTAGLRGKTGAGTNRMNFLTVGKATVGIARYICSKGQEAMEKGVVITHDCRHFSREFCRLCAEILASAGIRVYTFPDLRPTPELAFMIRHLHAISGINITASHNPKEYNGYKVYWEDGCQVSSTTAEEMSRSISQVDIWNDIPSFDFEKGIESGLITILSEEYDRAYLDRIEQLAIHSGDDLDLSIPIVYTPLNGCGSVPFQQMLRDRGFTNWMVVPEQEHPDPDFTTVSSPNPENPAAFALSEQYGKQRHAELLMATDPDGDRFAIEILSSEGEYIPLNGNQTGYLLVNYLLEGRKSAGILPEKGAIVQSIVTSSFSRIIAEDYGVSTFESLTGFKNICGKIPELQEKGFTYLLGYEESIGYSACEEIRDKDGISTGMLIAEAAAYYKKQNKTLWDVLQELYQKYGYYAEDAASIVLEGISGAERIERMMRTFRENPPAEAAGIPITELQDFQNGFQDIPPQNAIRVYLENDSWFALRPSGTEPKLKLYFYSVQKTQEQAHIVNRIIKEAILEWIRKVQ